MARRTRLALLVTAAAVVCLLAVAASVAEARSSLSVSVTPGTLPEAKSLARARQRVGEEWLFGFTAGEEDAFFDAENTATRQWREWRNHVRSLRAYRQQHGKNNAAAGAGDETNGHDNRGGDVQTSNLADYFTERQVQRRIQERNKKQGTFNVTTVDGAKAAWVEVGNDIGALWDRLRSAGSSASPTDQSYRGLVERHFAHTHVDTNSNGNSTSLASNDGAGSAPSMLTLLRSPIVLDAEMLPHLDKELHHLQGLWSRRTRKVVAAGATAGDEVDSTVVEVEEQLGALGKLVNSSRASVAQVILLADALADAAAGWVASTAATTQDAVLANDESTEAKRAELKLLLKQQSRLLKIKRLLERHIMTYKGALHRSQPANAEAVLFALELVAQQRLGDQVSGVLEELPRLSTTAPFTGLLEGEWWTHILYPYGWCLVLTAAFLWLTQETKEWCLRRVQASRLRMAAGGRSPRGASSSSSGTGKLRKLFMLTSLLEVLVPHLLPTVVLLWHLRRNVEWAAGVVAVMRPSQRVVCLLVFVCLSRLNYEAGRLVRRLFTFIDPSAYRRRHAKTK